MTIENTKSGTFFFLFFYLILHPHTILDHLPTNRVDLSWPTHHEVDTNLGLVFMTAFSESIHHALFKFALNSSNPVSTVSSSWYFVPI